MNYDEEKWHKALSACQSALKEAESAGHKLFTLEQSEQLREQQKVELPFVPNKLMTGADAEKNKDFLKRVMLMRYMVTTRVNEGNTETIWGLANQGNYLVGSLPHRTVKNNQGTWKGGWSGIAPTLNALARFYKEDGTPVNDWQDAKYYQSAGIEDRTGIINFNISREPRFYAWVAFDDGDFGNELADGKPLKLQMRNSELHGYNPDLFNRDNCETGFLNQKFFPANYRHHPR